MRFHYWEKLFYVLRRQYKNCSSVIKVFPGYINLYKKLAGFCCVLCYMVLLFALCATPSGQDWSSLVVLKLAHRRELLFRGHAYYYELLDYGRPAWRLWDCCRWPDQRRNRLYGWVDASHELDLGTSRPMLWLFGLLVLIYALFLVILIGYQLRKLFRFRPLYLHYDACILDTRVSTSVVRQRPCCWIKKSHRQDGMVQPNNRNLDRIRA